MPVECELHRRIAGIQICDGVTALTVNTHAIHEAKGTTILWSWGVAKIEPLGINGHHRRKPVY
jgi:hypothetical protein